MTSQRNAMLFVAAAGLFGWQSWLGGVLDPIADKLMLTACYISLGMIGAHPDWLTWLVVGRDVAIVAGAVAYHNLIGRIEAAPTQLSKLTTCIQIAYVLAQLVALSSLLDLPGRALAALIWLVALLTLASGAQYVVLWSRKALLETRRARSADNRGRQ